MCLGKYKLKTTMSTTTYVLKWLKLKMPAIPNVDDDESHIYTAGRKTV